VRRRRPCRPKAGEGFTASDGQWVLVTQRAGLVVDEHFPVGELFQFTGLAVWGPQGAGVAGSQSVFVVGAEDRCQCWDHHGELCGRRGGITCFAAPDRCCESGYECVGVLFAEGAASRRQKCVCFVAGADDVAELSAGRGDRVARGQVSGCSAPRTRCSSA
jgi:hypothetical protein